MQFIESLEGPVEPKAGRIGEYWQDLNYTNIYENCTLQELQDKHAGEYTQPIYYIGKEK